MRFPCFGWVTRISCSATTMLRQSGFRSLSKINPGLDYTIASLATRMPERIPGRVPCRPICVDCFPTRRYRDGERRFRAGRPHTTTISKIGLRQRGARQGCRNDTQRTASGCRKMKPRGYAAKVAPEQSATPRFGQIWIDTYTAILPKWRPIANLYVGEKPTSE